MTVHHIAFKKNGRTVKTMGDYPTQEAAACDAKAMLDAGTVPAGVSVFACPGGCAAKANPRKATKRNPHASMAGIRAANKAKGGKWFDRGAAKFFGTKIVGGPYGGHYFVTSEVDPGGVKKFSVRHADDAGNIDTVGDFHSYSTKAAAVDEAKKLGGVMRAKRAAKVNPAKGRDPSFAAMPHTYAGGYAAGVTMDKWHDQGRTVHALRADNSPACGARYYTASTLPGATLFDVTCRKCEQIVRNQIRGKTPRKPSTKRNPAPKTVMGHEVVKDARGYVVKAYDKAFSTMKDLTAFLRKHVAAEMAGKLNPAKRKVAKPRTAKRNPAAKKFVGEIGGYTYAVKIPGLDPDALTRSFGQSMPAFQHVKEWKASGVKTDWISTKPRKGQKKLPQLRAWLKSVAPSEFYARWSDSSNDDSHEIFYKP